MIAALHRAAALLALAVLPAACANFSAISPGESALTVEARVGAPGTVWKNADGSEVWEYPLGPTGVQTFMIDIGTDRAVQAVRQVLREETFSKVVARMSPDEVRRLLAVHRHLKQDFADFLAAAAVGERALHVGLEFVRAVQSGEHAEVDEAAELARQLRPRPQPSPAGLGHQFLHRHAEIIDGLELAVDVFGSEHFLAHGESLVPQFFRHGAILSVDSRATLRPACGSTRRSSRSTASPRHPVC